MGWGNITGVLQADPIPPPEPHAMAFLWVVLGFLLFGSSSGKLEVQAGLAAPDQASPTPGPRTPRPILSHPHPRSWDMVGPVLAPLITRPGLSPATPLAPPQPLWVPLLGSPVLPPRGPSGPSDSTDHTGPASSWPPPYARKWGQERGHQGSCNTHVCRATGIQPRWRPPRRPFCPAPSVS